MISFVHRPAAYSWAAKRRIVPGGSNEVKFSGSQVPARLRDLWVRRRRESPIKTTLMWLKPALVAVGRLFHG